MYQSFLTTMNHDIVLPSGNFFQFAIENGPVEIVDESPLIAWWWFSTLPTVPIGIRGSKNPLFSGLSLPSNLSAEIRQAWARMASHYRPRRNGETELGTEQILAAEVGTENSSK